MTFVFQVLLIFIMLALVVLFVSALLFLAGIVLLIIGLVRRKKDVNNGKKYINTFIVLGCVFMVIPIMLIGRSVVDGVAAGIEQKIKSQSYENCVDKWRNEWVSSNGVREDIIEEFFEAADNKDKDALIALYSEDIQKDADLENQVEVFLKEYPSGLANLEFEYKSGHESGSSEYGISSEYLNASYEVEKDGEYYYITFGGYYENDEEPDKIGLDYMVINSEKANVLKDESDYERGDDEHIIADINVIEDFETRRIAGIPYRYVEKDIIYTREEVLDAIRESYDLYDLYSYLGEPNGVSGRLNYIVYEIKSDENVYKYIEITHTDGGEIIKDLTCIVGTEEDAIVRFNENLEVESTEK